MNTYKNQEKSPAKILPALSNPSTAQPGNASPAKENSLNPPFVHEAEIITPQPYGIFALCKIMEHFQIN